jgi:O-antigen/teichoic acid export membrane protein
MDATKTSSHRYTGILKGASTALLSRGLAVALNLLSVSLALPYLGAELFGAWAAVATVQLWLQLADFGLSAGITTPMAAAIIRGQPDDARRVLGTSLCTAALGSVAVFALATLAVKGFGVTRIFHFHSSATQQQFDVALLLTVGMTVLGTPNAIITRVLLIQQRPYTANVWQLAGQLAALIGMAVCAHGQRGLVTLTLVTVVFPVIANIACMVWFFRTQPELRFSARDVDYARMGNIWHISAAYSALQLAGMLLLNSSIFLAASVISPAAAAEFSVTSRLTTLCSVAAQLVAPYFWTAYTDALVKSDHSWLRIAFRRHLMASVGIAAVTAVFLLVLAPRIITRWTGGQMAMNLPLFGWSLAWQLVVAAMNPVGALLNAHDRYGLQTVTSFAAGIAALWLGGSFSSRYGVAAVAGATTISYLVLTVIPVSVQARRLL